MASLTSARARNRGGGAGAAGSGNNAQHQQQQQHQQQAYDGGTDQHHAHCNSHRGGADLDIDTTGKSDKPYYPPSPKPLGGPGTTTNYAQRPFGSTTHTHSASPSTSGWVTSGSYTGDKTKIKGKTAAKVGTGPLRDYGGGLGVVGHGEFKLLLLIVLLAGVVRLWRLDRPASVVFDEVHFGGFATKYLKGKFFMDVHPPLAKLLITFAAWFSGFRGNFDFKDIGKEYGPDHVPYIGMRLLPATMGVALIPIAYLTLRSLGCRPATALLASLLLTFENGLITQSRLILLDSPLIFFTGLTTFFWVGFCSEDGKKTGSSQYGAFSKVWWTWLVMTGIGLGATLSCKWVGLFTIATIGLATIEQLWGLLGDTKIPMKTLVRHFFARAFALIVVPVFVYMFWFWIHFMILSSSGDGDGFMSSEFQHTLRGHGMEDTFADVMLGSRITLRHVHTQGGYLHSHPHNYPGGSKQQQITLYPHKDDNNDWIVVNETQTIGDPLLDPQINGEAPQYVLDKTFIRLHHAPSGKKLHSHDIRPPVSEVDFQNEVSAYGFPNFAGDANDNFQIEFVKDETDRGDRYAMKRLRTLRTKFRLRHVLTGCYLFSHKVKLPDWGFEQQEVTCNKNPTKANSIWYVETSTHPNMPPKSQKVNYRRPSFLAKFLELQGVMWRTNAGLTDRHAYDSRPQDWPYLRRGINFWVKDHRQIYLIGNPVTWWISSLSVVLYALARGFIIIRAKRGYQDLNNTTVHFYDRLCGFLFVGWALHYFPFFIMNRQLFLHHYFPALYYSVLLFASVFDLATSTLKPKFRVQLGAIVLICALWSFYHWSPLVYAGTWTKSACEDSKWLKNWDFSCADFHQHYSDYDNVIHPTPSKPVVHGGVGSVPAVEAETPSVAATIIEPGKDAFAADKDDPPPAPKSAVGDYQLFEQASVAHEEAEKKKKEEEQKGVPAAQREPELDPEAEEEEEKRKEQIPTNVPGVDLPASLAEQIGKKEVEQEINNEPVVPLEEAAPTPDSSLPEAAVAQDDIQKEAGARQVRLADVEDRKAGQDNKERPVEQDGVRGDRAKGPADSAREEAGQAKLNVQLDADALAALEEKERYERAEAEAKAGKIAA